MSISVLPQGCTCYTTIPCKLHGVTYSPHRIQSTADEPAAGQVSPKTQVEGSRATNPPSAPAAGPDAQTPRTDALYASIDGKLPSIQFGEMFAHARQLEREVADLRRQLAAFRDPQDEVTPIKTPPDKAEIERWRRLLRNYAVAVKSSTVIAWLDALELRAETAEVARDANAWKRDELEAALAAERAAYQVACELQEREREATLVRFDNLNRRCDTLQIVAVAAARDRAAAADLAREECIAVCRAHRYAATILDGRKMVAYTDDLESAIRAAIADPAAVRRTMDEHQQDKDEINRLTRVLNDLEATERLFEWLEYNAIPEEGEWRLVVKCTERLQSFRAAINAARKGEEGK